MNDDIFRTPGFSMPSSSPPQLVPAGLIGVSLIVLSLFDVLRSFTAVTYRKVRVKIDAKCKGQTCRGGSLVASGESIDEKNDGWCELLLSQHVPQGSYIDVDEVKVRTKDDAWACDFVALATRFEEI